MRLPTLAREANSAGQSKSARSGACQSKTTHRRCLTDAPRAAGRQVTSAAAPPAADPVHPFRPIDFKGDFSMHRLIAATFVVGTLMSANVASAMVPAPIATDISNVVRVAGGCGPGFHRGPYGGCLQNYANPGAHACPRGFHIGPNGGCRGNGR
jgi:hypothetical protein